MFKKKKLYLIGLMSIIFIFSGCSSELSEKSDERETSESSEKSDERETSESSEKSNKIKISELFEKVKKENNNIESIALLNEGNNKYNGKETQQVLKAELINDKDTKKIIKGKARARYTGYSNDEQRNYDAEFLGDKNKTMIITRKINGVTKTEKQNGVYEAHPDYFRLLDNIYSFNEDDLTLEEVNDEYHLKIKNDDNNKSKIISLLKSEYNLSLKKVTENEIDIKFEAVFDKKTFYLKNVTWTLEYTGNKGPFKIDNVTTYSDWNNVKLDENR